VTRLVLACLVAGCLRGATGFHCASDADCTLGAQSGTCEPATSYCSYPDANCVYGRRYNSYAGSDANLCVMPMVDAAPPTCPGFVTLGGVPGGHLYHLITSDADYQTQSDACGQMMGNAYLAVPDTPQELQALAVLAVQPTVWVGIDDRATPGSYVTAKGDPATFLPWGPGQPDSSGQCVEAVDASDTLADQPCSAMLRAVCECEP